MPAEPVTRPSADPSRLAGDARSILAWPRAVSLVVDGVPDVVDDEEALGLRDCDGSPVFSCRPESATARAAARQCSALLTVESGVVSPTGGSDALTLAGRLEARGLEDCGCCQEVRHVVVLELNFVLLTRTPAGPGSGTLPEQQYRVPLDAFRSPAHQLNRGFLRRSVEHANDCHQTELRQAVAATTGLHQRDLLAVSLADLTPRGVEVDWVDVDGAHRSGLAFPRPARTTAELGEMLRRRLHAGLC